MEKNGQQTNWEKRDQKANQEGRKQRNKQQDGQSPAVVRNYKDTVFRMVFREKKELLSLFNAINGTDYRGCGDLHYVSRLYEVMAQEQSLYFSKRIPLPTPRFIVLYNGKEEQPERKELRLSDSYMVNIGEVNAVFLGRKELLANNVKIPLFGMGFSRSSPRKNQTCS